MWCPSTSVQHCAPYTPGGRLQCSISRPRLLSSDTGRCCTPLRALLPLQCCAFTWQKHHFHKAHFHFCAHTGHFTPTALSSYGSLNTYSAAASSILTAVTAHSTPLRLDVYYISLQLQPASAQYITTLTLGTFWHRTAGTFPVPSFGHHSIGPQRRTGRGVFTGVDLGPAIRLRTVGPEAPGHKVPRRLAGLGSLPRFPGVLLPFLCQANKRL